MTPLQLSQSIKQEAKEAGFDLCAICPAQTPAGLDHFHQWLKAGYHGEMEYMAARRDAYADPGQVMQGARSIVMLTFGYHTAAPSDPIAGHGQVSRYAWGTVDYHDLIHKQLKQLKSAVLALNPRAKVRGVVDTAPLLEREFAVLAGLGWQGKNTLLLNKSAGSYFFLAALLVDFELAYDQPHMTDHCGTCTACLQACPTDAFVAPNVLDATRCISYLTIELRNPIPQELREPMGDWVFGCDVCQDVCPWNSKSQPTDTQQLYPAEKMNPLDLLELFDMDDDSFRTRFRKTPLWRSRRRGILRNAAIVLGNQKNPQSIPALLKGVNDPEPLVRGASAWAIGQIGNPDSIVALQTQLSLEQDEEVLAEIRQAIKKQTVQ